ncbi:MAG: helix-turn-helix domain-containing protein [Bacteroidales bacterium]|nr:helix-turn-helix domain-containing protein [Bacteroidales bacterium]
MTEEMIERISRLLEDVDTLIEAVNSLRCSIKLERKITYTNHDMMEMFSITAPTLRKWRNEGELSYTQIGDKFYYSAEDIKQFLLNHHNLAYIFEK